MNAMSEWVHGELTVSSDNTHSLLLKVHTNDDQYSPVYTIPCYPYFTIMKNALVSSDEQATQTFVRNKPQSDPSNDYMNRSMQHNIQTEEQFTSIGNLRSVGLLSRHEPPSTAGLKIPKNHIVERKTLFKTIKINSESVQSFAASQNSANQILSRKERSSEPLAGYSSHQSENYKFSLSRFPANISSTSLVRQTENHTSSHSSEISNKDTGIHQLYSHLHSVGDQVDIDSIESSADVSICFPRLRFGEISIPKKDIRCLLHNEEGIYEFSRELLPRTKLLAFRIGENVFCSGSELMFNNASHALVNFTGYLISKTQSAVQSNSKVFFSSWMDEFHVRHTIAFRGRSASLFEIVLVPGYTYTMFCLKKKRAQVSNNRIERIFVSTEATRAQPLLRRSISVEGSITFCAEVKYWSKSGLLILKNNMKVYASRKILRPISRLLTTGTLIQLSNFHGYCLNDSLRPIHDGYFACTLSSIHVVEILPERACTNLTEPGKTTYFDVMTTFLRKCSSLQYCISFENFLILKKFKFPKVSSTVIMKSGILELLSSDKNTSCNTLGYHDSLEYKSVRQCFVLSEIATSRGYLVACCILKDGKIVLADDTSELLLRLDGSISAEQNVCLCSMIRSFAFKDCFLVSSEYYVKESTPHICYLKSFKMFSEKTLACIFNQKDEHGDSVIEIDFKVLNKICVQTKKSHSQFAGEVRIMIYSENTKTPAFLRISQKAIAVFYLLQTSMILRYRIQMLKECEVDDKKYLLESSTQIIGFHIYRVEPKKSILPQTITIGDNQLSMIQSFSKAEPKFIRVAKRVVPFKCWIHSVELKDIDFSFCSQIPFIIQMSSYYSLAVLRVQPVSWNSPCDCVILIKNPDDFPIQMGSKAYFQGLSWLLNLTTHHFFLFGRSDDILYDILRSSTTRMTDENKLHPGVPVSKISDVVTQTIFGVQEKLVLPCVDHIFRIRIVRIRRLEFILSPPQNISYRALLVCDDGSGQINCHADSSSLSLLRTNDNSNVMNDIKSMLLLRNKHSISFNLEDEVEEFQESISFFERMKLRLVYHLKKFGGSELLVQCRLRIENSLFGHLLFRRTSAERVPFQDIVNTEDDDCPFTLPTLEFDIKSVYHLSPGDLVKSIESCLSNILESKLA